VCGSFYEGGTLSESVAVGGVCVCRPTGCCVTLWMVWGCAIINRKERYSPGDGQSKMKKPGGKILLKNLGGLKGGNISGKGSAGQKPIYKEIIRLSIGKRKKKRNPTRLQP